MKIAVCYRNGQIFQHFGKTECFKLYEVENGQILRTELMDSGDTGHEALAGLLAEKGVEQLICGGMGSGAQAALAEAGITVFAGAEGSADDAVEALLAGELGSTGVNCHHHDEEQAESCCCGCGEEEEEEGCGGDCGGCCSGGCCGGTPEILFDGPNAGHLVRVHYRGTLEDGGQFDSSYEREEPLEFTCGVGMMIAGFDKAVAEMVPGEIRDVKLPPEEAYGEPDPNAIFTVPLDRMPGAEQLEAGQRVVLRSAYGQPVPVRVVAKDAESITFDANHELAGQTLNFRIELLEVL